MSALLTDFCSYGVFAEFLNPNPHTVPCVPNRYGTRGVRGTLVLPNPIHQPIYFSLVGATSLGSVSQPRVGGGRAGRGVGDRAGGGGVRGVSAPRIQ